MKPIAISGLGSPYLQDYVLFLRAAGDRIAFLRLIKSDCKNGREMVADSWNRDGLTGKILAPPD